MVTKQVWNGVFVPQDYIPAGYPKNHMTITIELSETMPDSFVWGGLVAMAPFHQWQLAEWVELPELVR